MSRAPTKSILKRTSLARTHVRPLSRSISDRIPQEVVDAIICCLHFDRVALIACSYVSRAWLTHSRHHLFHFHKVHVDPRNATKFFAIAQFPNSTVLPHIAQLSIQRHYGHIRHPMLIRPGSTFNCHPQPIEDYKFDDILRYLTPYETLTSLSLCEGPGKKTLSVSHLPAFPTLRKLEFRACSFPSFDDLISAIRAPRNLQHLILTDVDWEGIPAPWLGDDLFPQLRILEVFISHKDDFFGWLLENGQARSIESLQLGGGSWEISDNDLAVGLFLQVLGPKLRHLSLYSSCRINHVDLSYNVKLETLIISHLQEINEIPTFLAQISSPFMTSIIFHPLLPEDTPVDSLDWDLMRRALLRPIFSNMRCLQFRIDRGCRGLFASRLREFLPELAARNILSVSNSGIH
ncbi:hypothetical protein BDQ17DRAFT_1428013 [Cyathus striatus]|nr:hypothetical protein BDQ17DRAFT_1428013 [Cyathus striatus]